MVVPENQSLITLCSSSPPPTLQGFQNTEIQIQILAGERKVEGSLEKATLGICPVALGVGDVSWVQVSGALCLPQSTWWLLPGMVGSRETWYFQS